MTRSYDVTSMEVLPQLDAHSDVVIKLNFTYGDASASLKGSCSLPAPEGTFLPLESISKATALQWLLANCSNTTEEFDANLDAQIAAKANRPFVYDWTEPAPEA
jgi:hypothetical protein